MPTVSQGQGQEQGCHPGVPRSERSTFARVTAVVFQGLHWQEAEVRSQSQDSDPGASMWNSGIGVLTPRPNTDLSRVFFFFPLHKHFVKFIVCLYW